MLDFRCKSNLRYSLSSSSLALQRLRWHKLPRSARPVPMEETIGTTEKMATGTMEETTGIREETVAVMEDPEEVCESASDQLMTKLFRIRSPDSMVNEPTRNFASTGGCKLSVH